MNPPSSRIPEQAWWSATRDPLLDFSEDASAEATAFAVKFLSRQKPDSPLLPKAALWLMNHRNEGYWWDSTKQTAMVIYGLTDYLRATHELTGNITATVYVNGAAVMTRKLDQITLDESQLAPGANHIRITAQGEGRVYYSTRAQYSSADEKLQKTGTVALNLLRDYFKLAPSKQADHIVYDLNPLNGPVAVGDIVAVRLTVTGSEWKYLMVEDPIPAGTEFIERDSVYELREKPPWWQYLFTRRELHDDRMALFQTYFPQGQQQYFYLLKVVNPGIFQVSPARVQPMYQPGVMATSDPAAWRPNETRLTTASGLSAEMQKSPQSLPATGSFRRPMQLVGNAAALLLGYYWLSIGEARAGLLVWSFTVALFTAALFLWIHGAGLSYGLSSDAPYRAALRRLPALLVAAIVVLLLYIALGKLQDACADPSFRFASWLTLKLRKPVKPAAVLSIVAAIFWLIRWIVLPIVFLPLIRDCARHVALPHVAQASRPARSAPMDTAPPHPATAPRRALAASSASSTGAR